MYSSEEQKQLHDTHINIYTFLLYIILTHSHRYLSLESIYKVLCYSQALNQAIHSLQNRKDKFPQKHLEQRLSVIHSVTLIPQQQLAMWAFRQKIGIDIQIDEKMI